MSQNLPSYLQNLPSKNLNEVATLGIGSSLPPHISIRGNTFTLIDASGAEQVAGPVLDICVADISDVICKQFYSEKWSPDSAEPPLCWSANGVAPSRDAMQPQSPTCAACPNNQRGSAVSAISGVGIKACRDEKWLAVLIPQMPTMRFQLKLTPGSFKNWREYLEKCKGTQTDIGHVVTRLTFEAKTNGVLLFQAISYIDEPTAKAKAAGYAEKAFDVLVGRNDVPIQGALPAPVNTTALQAPPAQANVMQTAPSPQAFAPSATGAAPTPEQPQRRKRRTQAEIAADAATNGTGQAPAQPAPAFAPQPAAPIAPFRPQPVAEATNPVFAGAAPQQPSAPAQPPGAQFGIQPGVAPNPEIQGVLNTLFAKPQ